MSKRYLVTGGAGFIGSAVARHLIGTTSHRVLVVDKLTYAGNLDNLAAVAHDERYGFVCADICDGGAMRELMQSFQPDIVMHLAAESHVDRSIDGPGDFLQTNVVGTYALLQAARGYWDMLDDELKKTFRFHHVSTDEVFGSLDMGGTFTETTAYCPTSPYSATKAAADHLVRAWGRTYGLPVILSNCSNNYGPYQFPEKLIPLTVLNALEGKPIPVYGTGDNRRDWLHVDDHARALQIIAERGRIGESYNVGGDAERANLDVVRSICALIDELSPDAAQRASARLITFVADRPGHDLRYAIDTTRLRTELGWAPRQSFDSGLRATVRWYLDNSRWWQRIRAGLYRGERLGVLA